MCSDKSNNSVCAESKSVQKLFDLEQITIPPYQRPYRWSEHSVIRLLEDIYDAKRSVNADRYYRIGTVILHKNKECQKNGCQYNIVDGQQRLVTLALILHYLEGKFPNDSIKQWEFDHPDSRKSIATNYCAIKNWFDGFNIERNEFKNYICDKCEFVVITLCDLSAAFQLFDSQNARGKALEPYDLLKAFHLREMTNSKEDEKKACVIKWEAAVEKQLLGEVIGTQLYRIRKWARYEYAKKFTKENVGEFKGANLEKDADYPYLQPCRINNDAINVLPCLKLQYPFQITQTIINGKLFFEYIQHYCEVYENLFLNEDFAGAANFYEFYISDAINYDGHNRAGDTYVRELYQATLLLYWDRFGSFEFDRFFPALYRWCYALRLIKGAVKYPSIDKYIIDDDYKNIIKIISEAYRPAQLGTHYMPMLDENKEKVILSNGKKEAVKKEIDKIIAAFQKTNNKLE